MEKQYSITAPDGSELSITGPADATPEQLRAAAERAFALKKQTSQAPQPAPQEQAAPQTAEPEQQSIWQSFVQGNKDKAGGLIRGAASIGATAVEAKKSADKAIGKAWAAATGRPDVAQAVEQMAPGGFIDRRAGRLGATDAALQNLGADPQSSDYAGGKLISEVAGTMGVGGAVAAPVKYFAALRASPAMSRVAAALESAGFSLGSAGGSAAANVATRAGAGGVVGAVSAGVTEPETALAGGVIGAALPPAAIAAKWGGGKLADIIKNPASDAAQRIMRATGLTLAQLQQAAKAEELVAGARPSLGQATQNPAVNTLEDVVHDMAGPQNALRTLRNQQSQARDAALEGVSPTWGTGYGEARADFGQAVASRVVPEEAAISKQVGALYNKPELQNTRLYIPLGAIESVADKFGQAGAFLESATFNQALNTARQIGKEPQPWSVVQAFRSDLQSAQKAAASKPETKKAAAAFTELINAVDDKIESAASGMALPGEAWSRAASDAWKTANAAHANKMQRFKTGPQKDIFTQGKDGQPKVQSGEVSRLFWGNRPGIAEDVQSFRRLVDDNPQMLGMFRSLVTTDAAAHRSAGGLGQGFVDWYTNALPGLRQAFEPAEVETLGRIAKDIERSLTASATRQTRGSKTAGTVAQAMRSDLLENPVIKVGAAKVPFGASARDWMAQRVEGRRAGAMADLFANPEEMLSQVLLNQGRLGPTEIKGLKALAMRQAPVILANE